MDPWDAALIELRKTTEPQSAAAAADLDFSDALISYITQGADALESTLNPPPRPWHEVARADQLCALEDEQLIWLIMAGRGWGKTRTGAEWLAEEAETHAEQEYAIVAPTYRDVRDICVQGPSGILKAFTEPFSYNKALGTITLVNGSVIHMITAEVPDQGRGYNLAGVWCDEIGTWRYPATWYEGIAPALRIGHSPKAVFTTTPRVNAFLRDIVHRNDGTVKLTRGTTQDNAANLSPLALAELYRRYEGTRLGRQELYGELLEDIPGALWSLGMIEADREHGAPASIVERCVRIVVAIDPAVTSGEDSDETGIIVVGKDVSEHYYVLADCSGRFTPDEWATAALAAYDTWSADRIVAEVNNGGDLVETIIRSKNRTVSYNKVHASRGKKVRAEPVSALYEQHRVHHVGALVELETQMCAWVPDDPAARSPDRMDALVWAIKELEGPTGMSRIGNPANVQPASQLAEAASASNAYARNALVKDYTKMLIR